MSETCISSYNNYFQLADGDLKKIIDKNKAETDKEMRMMKKEMIKPNIIRHLQQEIEMMKMVMKKVMKKEMMKKRKKFIFGKEKEIWEERSGGQNDLHFPGPRSPPAWSWC